MLLPPISLTSVRILLQFAQMMQMQRQAFEAHFAQSSNMMQQLAAQQQQQQQTQQQQQQPAAAAPGLSAEALEIRQLIDLKVLEMHNFVVRSLP